MTDPHMPRKISTCSTQEELAALEAGILRARRIETDELAAILRRRAELAREEKLKSQRWKK